MAIGKLAFSTRTASTTMIAVKSVLLSAVLASTMVAAAQPKSPQPQSQAKPPAQLELFGVQLKSATREQLREVFEAGGLQPVRVEDKYWVDTYSAAGVLDGASASSPAMWAGPELSRLRSTSSKASWTPAW